MGGGWQTYRCERCSLTIEFGGAVWWDEAWVVYLQPPKSPARRAGPCAGSPRSAGRAW